MAKRKSNLKIEIKPPHSWWEEIKLWSGWKAAGSILNARVTAVSGFIVGVIGLLDFSPLLSLGIETGLNWTHVAWTGGIMMAKGVIDEIVRRSNAKDLKA